jgi:hypothetical protein
MCLRECLADLHRPNPAFAAANLLGTAPLLARFPRRIGVCFTSELISGCSLVGDSEGDHASGPQEG